MSKISEVYEQILIKLGELFPDKTRIPNAYALIENNKHFLSDGYGLKIGSAEFQEFEFCNFVVNRTITVVFTREMFRVDSELEPTDTIVKELMENVVETQSLFYSYNELGIEAKILKVDIGSVSGIETFYGEKQNFLTMSCDFSFQIQEEIS
jgi:hypothetical protein